MLSAFMLMTICFTVALVLASAFVFGIMMLEPVYNWYMKLIEKRTMKYIDKAMEAYKEEEL